jgi:deazaflavin-dependent oxidoreductase (nitroreductase family)
MAADPEFVARVRKSGAEHLRRFLEADGEDEGSRNGRILILTTTGRRSGEERSIPLIYGEDGDNYILIASLGGAPHHPAWYLNLRDDPNVFVQVKAERFAARARTATGEERERTRTTREIPVVVVERV